MICRHFLPFYRLSFHFADCFFFSAVRIALAWCSPTCWFSLVCHPISWYLSKGNKNRNIDKIPTLPCLLQHYSQQPRCGKNLSVCQWWLDKEDLVPIYTLEYYAAVGKTEILPFVTTWIKLEGIRLSEISQTEEDKHCMYSLMRGI